MQKHVWRKAAASTAQNGCVEVRLTDTAVLVRDTKDRGGGPVLRFTHAEWLAFQDGMGRGEFDIEAS